MRFFCVMIRIRDQDDSLDLTLDEAIDQTR